MLDIEEIMMKRDTALVFIQYSLMTVGETSKRYYSVTHTVVGVVQAAMGGGGW